LVGGVYEETTMLNLIFDPKSDDAIELNDEQLKSITGGRKGGDDRLPYFVIEMKQVTVTSWN
jgi:bacteriocin-like protein